MMMERLYQHFGLWGAVVVSLIVLPAFAVLCGFVIFHEIPPGSKDVANIMLGSLGTMAVNVVGYWTGSSSGSLIKTMIGSGDANK